MSAAPVRLRLPATSANLGPAFDAAALALALFLEVEAVAAPSFSIDAMGRDRGICGALAPNLLLETYCQTWAAHAQGEPQPLALRIANGIPLGMGCGSSAASRIAGLALAVHFAGLGWSRARLLNEAATLEGHPDNAAACICGGFTVAAVDGGRVRAASVAPPASWLALLALPSAALATAASRAVLPAVYPREVVAENLQNTALLTAAFAAGDQSLLVAATRDRVHQPFRAEACPLLRKLLPLAGREGILSVTLSGAGAGVLLLLAEEQAVKCASDLVRQQAGNGALAELLVCALSPEPAVLLLNEGF